MEIKVLCDCGTKFKFDVEPVNGRMPAPVFCPACSADATAKANAFIQSAAPAAPVDPVGAPTNPPVPPAMAPSRLRINLNRPAAPETATEPAAEAPIIPPMRPAPPARAAKGKHPVVKVLGTLLTVALVIFGAWRVGSKWAKRVNLVAQVASAIGEGSVEAGESEGAKNLWYDDCAALFIKHPDHRAVAAACTDFWKTQLHKNLSVSERLEPSESAGEYELIAAHNGYVRIIGTHDWPVAQHEALAKHLSQKFGTMVFEWRSESFADTYHFAVYDQGTRKFHAQMDIKMTKDDADEIVTTEGDDFAIANGYKPGPKGFKEFNVLDADKITQRLGLKIWDEKEEVEQKGLFLKESGPAR
jgi:hypothetical protein